MQTVFYRAVVARAAAGLALVILGSAVFASSISDNWISLLALLVHFGGLMLLYSAIQSWMDRFGGRRQLNRSGPGSIGAGCAIALLRLFLLTLLILSAGLWLWFTAIDLNEMRLLLTSGRTVSATVVTRDIIAPNAPIGYINYAYRVTPTVAPVGKFAVARRDYPKFRTGQQIEITYSAAAPAVNRLSRVDWEYALRRLFYWLLLLANGGAYLFLPLWLLEFQRVKGKRPRQ